MFFKRTIPVSGYCTTRLDLLLSKEQADRWLTLKRSDDDPAFAQADEQNYLDHMGAAHIELMLIVIAQKSAFGQRAWDFLSEATEFTESYLVRHGQDKLTALRDIYNHAFGSSVGTPVDGILLMATSLAHNICGNECAQSTIDTFNTLLHVVCESCISDFKQVKLVSGDR